MAGDNVSQQRTGSAAVEIWNLVDGESSDSFLGPQDADGPVAVSAGGDTVAWWCTDGVIRIWDVATGTERHGWRANVYPHRWLVLSPDGRFLAFRDAGQMLPQVWDLSSGRPRMVEVTTGRPPQASRLLFSPDGRTLAGAMDKIILWEAATGRELQTIRGPMTYVDDLAFSPDSQRVVSVGTVSTSSPWMQLLDYVWPTGGSGIVELVLNEWDVKTGQEQCEWRDTCRGLISRLAFSPDGKTLAVGAADGTVTLWDRTR